MSSNLKHSLSLEDACTEVGSLLPNSDYLIDRHSINIGEDYTAISVRAMWLLEYDTISIEVVFHVTPEQEESMTGQIEDDEIRDDIDSAIGELMESCLRSKYPEYDWSCPIGEVNIKCQKI
jgi:hypothetical protein